MDNIRAYYQSHDIRRTILNEYTRVSNVNDEKLGKLLGKLFDHPGIELVHAAFENGMTKAYYEVSMDTFYKDEDEVDYSILEAVGLIRKVETGFFDVMNFSVIAVYYHLTDLGFYFAKACGVAFENSQNKS